MKLYLRIMLACGGVEYGVFCLLCLAGYYLGPLWYGVGGSWLAFSPRFVKRYVVSPFFPTTRCNNCHEIIALKARWSLGERFTDGKERHALKVYCNGEYEIGSFACPACKTTIYLQKVTKYRLSNWTIKDADTVSANLPATGDLQLGIVRGSMPPRLQREVREKLHLPNGTPVCTSFETLKKHMVVFGKTGSGKSTMLLSMARKLMEQGEGLTIFDPAGDLTDDLLKHVPASRVQDVVYFNVQDTKNPPPFNLLNESDDNDRNMLPDELISLFESLYPRSWGDKMTRLLRLAINAALEVEGSLVDVYDLLANPEARHRIASELKDPVLKDFWEEKILQRDMQATRYALINRLAEIVHHPYIGPIVQSRSCMINADEIIAKKKILIVNLNTGTKPGKTLKIVGTFIVSKILNAAYRQSRLKKEDRINHFLFVDEFSNFVSSSFDWENGLSQIRKYGLALCFITQYAKSIPERTRQAIFGNVAILAAFRIGNDDAKLLKEEFGCRTKSQLMNQKVGECRICIDGEFGALRTILLSNPLIHQAATIMKKTKDQVQAFRAGENDQYQSAEQREEEIRIIEQRAVRGELVLCEFA